MRATSSSGRADRKDSAPRGVHVGALPAPRPPAVHVSPRVTYATGGDCNLIFWEWFPK
jgi:hypothetical protein